MCVMGDSIVAGVMQVMSPFVDLFRPGIDGFLPFSILLETKHSVWGKHSQCFLLWNITKIFCNNQIDEVVGIGKAVCSP